MASFASGLYRGSGSVDIIGRRKIWYVLTGIIFLICLLSMIFRGFNLSIDFEGGTSVQLPTAGANGTITTEQVEAVYQDVLGVEPVSTQTVGTGDAASILARSESLSTDQTLELRSALFEELQPLGGDGQPSQQAVSDSAVSGSWGGEITGDAIRALIVFLVLVTLFLTLYFEFRMAIAALVSMINNVVITAGVYSVLGFEVSPATVIGLLTILGFSLYDTVVVFDKVQENTRGLLGLTRRTYAEAANLAVNQTLMRSINTSIIAVLPVVALLVIGVGFLGVGTLRDLALVQLVGVLVDTYSSLFIATPLLVDMTMRRQQYRDQAERVRQRRLNATRRVENTELGDTETDAGDLATVGGGASAAATGPRPTKPAPGARTTGGSRAQRAAAAAARPSGKQGRPTGKKRP